MAVFRGGRILAALEAVCSAPVGQDSPADVLDAVASLVDKSLVQQREGRDGEPRFWLLETIHEYAREKLAESSETEAMSRKHAGYFLAVAEEAEPHMRGPAQAAWMDRLEDEHDNFRAALRWTLDHGEAELALRLCGALEEFWHSHGHYREALTWLEEALAKGSHVTVFVRAKALNARAVMLSWLGHSREGFAGHQESLALFRQVGDKWWIAELLNNVGSTAQLFGEYERSRTLLEECLALRYEIGDLAGAAMAILNLAQIWDLQGNYEQARGLYAQGVELARQSRWTRIFYIGELCLGVVCCRLGEYAQAAAMFAESCRLAQEFGDRLYLATGLWGWARLAWVAGSRERAIRLLGAAAVQFQAISATPEPAHVQAYADDLTTWQTEVDPLTWQGAWAAGQALTLNEAVAYALEQTDLSAP
jgi:tetratricopeptide (TPR) repeat protein